MQNQTNTQAVAPEEPPAPAPRQHGSPWLAVLSVAIGAFALVTTEFLPVGLLPAVAAELGVTEGVAGMMVTIPGLVAAAAAILVTVGVGKTDRRYVIWGLTFMLVLSNALVAFAHSFPLLLIGRALLGVGVGGFWAIGPALSTRLVSPEAATRATAVVFAGVSVGTVAGVPAGAFLGELYGWRTAFVAAGAIGLLVLLTQMWLLPKLPPTQAITFRQLPELLRVHKARLGIIATVLVFLGQFAAYTYITPFLSQVTHLSATTISSLLLAYGAAGFLGNLVGGALVARSVRTSLIVTGLVLTVAIGALPLLGAGVWSATALVVLWGVGFGMMPISVQTWIFQAAPHAMESGGAVFVAIVQLALAGGALVGGVAVDHTGVWGAMALGGALALSMVAVIAIWTREEGKPTVKLHAVH